MHKTIELKNSLIQEVIEQLNARGFSTRKEADAYDRYHALQRIVAYCKYGTPRALIEVCLPDKDGVVTKSLPNTMIQAVPLYSVSSSQDIAALIPHLK